MHPTPLTLHYIHPNLSPYRMHPTPLTLHYIHPNPSPYRMHSLLLTSNQRYTTRYTDQTHFFTETCYNQTHFFTETCYSHNLHVLKYSQVGFGFRLKPTRAQTHVRRHTACAVARVWCLLWGPECRVVVHRAWCVVGLG
jgi:hypothetical protein